MFFSSFWIGGDGERDWPIVMMDDITDERLQALWWDTHPASAGRRKPVASASQQQAPVWAASPECAYLTHISVHNLCTAAWASTNTKCQWVALQVSCSILQKVYTVLRTCTVDLGKTVLRLMSFRFFAMDSSTKLLVCHCEGILG